MILDSLYNIKTDFIRFIYVRQFPLHFLRETGAGTTESESPVSNDCTEII